MTAVGWLWFQVTYLQTELTLSISLFIVVDRKWRSTQVVVLGISITVYELQRPRSAQNPSDHETISSLIRAVRRRKSELMTATFAEVSLAFGLQWSAW